MEESAKKPWDEEPIKATIYKDEKGRFLPGKRVGRPLGAPNATTKAIREAYTNIIEDHIAQIYDDLASLEPKDRLAALAMFSMQALPKLTAIAITEGDQTKKLSTIIDWGGNEETTDTD